jgi:adenosyl cobinamide kinase/adenosyl cobinamide phosphate guanylyltransferase
VACFLATIYRCLYRDLLGRVNQFVAQHANDVYSMVAGMPMRIKGN